MYDPSGDELLTKLVSSLRQHERNIRNGESKLCLTGNSVVFLNKCFAQALHTDHGKYGTGRAYSKSSQSSVDFLSNLSKEAISLKVIPGPSPRLDILLSISHFKSLQFLEIKKIPLGYITGLQSLRQQLKGLTCFRSSFALSEVFICCGGDLSSTPFAWERLQEANLSYNSINSIDDSLKVLPVLEVLNLSHNNIVSPDDDGWQSLSELKYINLGYNQLNKVPCASTLKHSLKTLILRNNDIQNLKGIEQFKLLEILDVSNNCIASFQELFPLAHLERLLFLQLAGNPVCYCFDYRVRAVSCMSPFPRRGDMFLDNVKLSPFEKTFVGISVDPVSPLAYLSTSVNNETVADSSQNMTDENLSSGAAKKKKSKKVKPRHVSIVSDIEDENAYSSSAVSSQGELSLDHSQDIERLEKARNLGGEHWLPAVNHVLHGEPTEQQPAKDEKLESPSSSPYFVHHENVIVDVNPPIERQSSIASLHSDDEQVVAGVIQPFIVTLKTMDTTNDCHEEDKDEHDLLVTITDHFIRERDFKNGKVVCKLETGSLLSANIEQSEDGDIFVHLKFDYLSRERKERFYIMDGRENCEQFMELLCPLMNSNEIAKKVIVTQHLQCLKCSAHFTENANKTSDHVCPDCGSTQIIEILSPEEPVNTRNADRSKELQKTLPDLISSVSPKGGRTHHPDIYCSSKGFDRQQHESELEVFNITEKSQDKIPSSNINSTANTESIHKQETRKGYSINQSPGFIIKDDAGFVVNKQFVAKSSSSLRTSVLSNSLKNLDLAKSNVEQTQEKPLHKTITPQKRVIDSPISLKTSTRQPSSDHIKASKAFQQPDDDLDCVGPSSVEKTINQRKISSNQTKVSSSPSSAPRVFRNLFNKLGSKISGSGASSSSDEHDSENSRTPKIGSKLIYDISPDEFKNCDHRLKLYFEVSVFTKGQKEFLNCLIKVPVVVYGDIKESNALLVVSNIAAYIFRLEETAGLSANECLSLLGSYSLKDLQFVDFGLSFHSFRLEFNGESPGCCTFLVRDTDRCKAFTDLLLQCVNQYKDNYSLALVVTTSRNLQTLAHLRTHILGLQQENVHTMGERYLQQATLFTNPPLIKDRKSLLRHYSKCFVGKDLVDWMIQNGEARRRTEAVEIVQRLVSAGLVEHVSKECKFEDKEQFYRFCLDQNEESKENGKDGQNYHNELSDTDTHIGTAIMAYKVLESTNKGMDVKPVTIIITSTHIAVGEENYQWPLPRYLDVPTPKDLQFFHCIEKHKMTDVIGLELFQDKPCNLGILISEEDAPLECADTYLLIKTETKSSAKSLVNAIKTPWEEQFGVELQTSSLPHLEK